MTDAEQLFFAGGAHARAAHAIAGAAQSYIHMAVPFYLLLGFSLETVLKAAFLHLGGDIKVAKDNIAHDLPTALVYAKELGFRPENDDLEWLANTMADAHRSHSFRYLTGDGKLIVPEEIHSLRILDGLIVQVGQLLYPQHDRIYWMELLTKFETKKSLRM